MVKPEGLKSNRYLRECSYFSICFVFCCFGQKPEHLQTIMYFTSFRGERLLFRWYTNLDWYKSVKATKITTTESESEVKSKLRLFKITSKKRWLNIKNRVLDHPDFHPTLPIPAPPSPPAPPARILSFLFSLVSNKVGSPPHALQPPWAGHDELSQSTLSISAFKVGVPPL